MAKDAIEIAKARALIRSGRAQAIRERAGLSRSEVAESVGVNDSTIARWETGERSPRGEGAKRYARLLRELAEAVPL
jgi:transcriptional regulator with XRE-family HTH domain